jgi:hypothetical protein
MVQKNLLDLIVAAVAAAVLMTSANSASASIQLPKRCWPHDNSARILRSASPNDIHPDWAGNSYIGTAWSFVPDGFAGDGTGLYFRGALFSSRGGLVNSDVYILAREWDCAP